MKPVTILNPAKLVFGNGSLQQCVDEISAGKYKRIFCVSFPEILPALQQAMHEVKAAGIEIHTDLSVISEPSVSMFLAVLKKLQDFKADCVLGIGGGSVLDIAKLLAALADGNQSINDVFGIGHLKAKALPVICLPTTSGTGSEMSPNAILLDEKENLKKGVISPFLVPDASYIDPMLTLSVPPSVTAATGLDALTHCLEAYTNKFAHPVIDRIALEGIACIGRSLLAAYKDGNDVEARTQLALGSMYGGMCLGPVNTAAVHALSYPLGSAYKIAHGLSNALLLPHVMRFNLPATIEKYAHVARALGVSDTGNNQQIAEKGIDKIIEISRACNVPLQLSAINIPQDDIVNLARSAMSVQRLLVNNPREVTLNDAISIYQAAW